MGGRATAAVMDPAEGRECAPQHAAESMARATYPHITIWKLYIKCELKGTDPYFHGWRRG